MFQLSAFATNGESSGRPRRKSSKNDAHRRTKRLAVQQLESRRLLAGDLIAEVTDGTLFVSGDNADNSVRIDTIERVKQDSTRVSGGVTSVFLDPIVLAVAGLEIEGAANTVQPADGPFQVGFAITEATDFEFTTDGGLSPLGGSIEHEGTVVLGFLASDATVTVGDFTIGFDAARASDKASGFFVADTFSGLGILFDVGAPGLLEVGESTLSVADADLLVSPEFAALLGNSALTGADAGDAQIDAMTVEVQQRRVDGGKTSVELDVALLESAAGLKLTSANGTARPAPGDFQVAFKILHDSDFSFDQGEGFVPLGGRIEHRGTVGFNEDTAAPIVVGNFSIGFDATRAVNGASGFFVEDTVAGLGILFDVGTPGTVELPGGGLTIADADLLVSPELASALGNDNLAGADVGAAQIDASTAKLREEFIRLSGSVGRGRTTINGNRSAEFLAADIQNLVIETGAGQDTVRVNRVSLPGNLTIDLGDGRRNTASVHSVEVDGIMSILGGGGRDTVRLIGSDFGALLIDTGENSDSVSLLRSKVANDAEVNLGGGRDRLSILVSRIGGSADFDGGPGFDRFDSIFSRFGELERNGFESGRLF